MAITIPKKLKPYIQPLFAILAGIIYPFGFAPYDFTFATFISILIFLFTIQAQKGGKSFVLGWLYGLGLFGFGASWVFVSIHVYGNTSFGLALVLTSLFVAILALYFGLFAALVNALFPKINLIRTVLGAPILWVLIEMARGWVFTGFPWLYLGYSQFDTHLRAFAPIGSVWAVSMATMLNASIFYYILYYYNENLSNKRERNSIIALFILLWAGAFGLHQIEWTKPSTKNMTVALLQGNIPQELKWQNDNMQAIANTYLQLTKQNLNKDLVLWPEAAMPLPLPYSGQYFQAIDTAAKEKNVAVLASAPMVVETPSTIDGQSAQKAYSNTIIGLGLAQGEYHKQHLVPFGEFVPFAKWLRGVINFFDLPMSNFLAVKNPSSHLFVKDFRVAPAICYEIAYPTLVQHSAKDADLLITVSNDTWFGTSIGPHQHLEIAQMRALETGKYLLRATNTGLTAIVNPHGEIEALAPQFALYVLPGEVNAYVGETPWVKYGVGPLFIVLGIGLLLAFYLDMRPQKKRK